jgi:hypothetical protein
MEGFFNMGSLVAAFGAAITEVDSHSVIEAALNAPSF